MRTRTSIELGDEQPLLLKAEQVAELLSVSERHVHKLHSSGRLPRPVRLGKSVRWRRDELEAWVNAGSPDRARWETLDRRARDQAKRRIIDVRQGRGRHSKWFN